MNWGTMTDRPEPSRAPPVCPAPGHNIYNYGSDCLDYMCPSLRPCIFVGLVPCSHFCRCRFVALVRSFPFILLSLSLAFLRLIGLFRFLGVVFSMFIVTCFGRRRLSTLIPTSTTS